MDEIDKQIINALQDGFPICDAPYRQVAALLGLTEQELIARLKALLDNGALTRFGPLYNAEQMGGALTLAAVKAPQQRYDEIAEIINAFPEVAHNYARSYELNMWFVIATETPGQIRQTISAIEQKTGLTVYNMPKKREYFVNLKLEA
ncbi:MAG: Lrp/AsnC family transcriptional regulator [Methylobacter sp.]|jgi:DNA-binding Lrp family transcriptional regulator|nr:Lrp/AsnC family transcriptional regulator [Methylobacter sp.]